MAKYKLSLLENGKQTSVIRTTDTAIIPVDEANRDYQEYLQFLADGGVPEPADE